MIGCGHWGKNLVRTFAELGALGAVVDPDAEQRGSARGAVLGAAADRSTRCSPIAEIDAVVIAAPAKDHAAVALEALEAGKHVFVEKPLALDVDGCRAGRRCAPRSAA